jgi:hypothetical protein
VCAFNLIVTIIYLGRAINYFNSYTHYMSES